MLTSLSIRNVVLIEKLDLDFQKGLCVFTGETGAGKSILLDSLSLAVGARADSSLVRKGHSQLSVTASFSVPQNHYAHELLTSHDIEVGDELILKRVVTADGKSKAYINGEPVGVGVLKTLGESLLEIHGQFASHHLLNPATHLTVLDSYGRLKKDVEAVRHAYGLWQELKSKRLACEEKLAAALKEEEFIRASIEELKELNPSPGEEEELTQKRTALMNVEKIMTALSAASQFMADETGGALIQITKALVQLEKANALSNNAFEESVDALTQAQEALNQSMSDLENKTADLNNEESLTTVDDRLFALKDVARKHRVTVAELPVLLDELEEKAGSLDKGQEQIISLKKQEEEARLNYKKMADTLSVKRKATAQKLNAAVAKELPDLKLSKASFMTQITSLTTDEGSDKGIDNVLFLVSTNAGTDFAPIHKIASGGELARFMLALKVNLAEAEEITTLIFDEVDTGIGGATADAVGKRLARLAHNCQVLVVTHSPQVAAYGAHHMVVGKKDKNGTVVTDVEILTHELRLLEVARMLSGAVVTESGRQMAQELLKKSCLDTASLKKRQNDFFDEKNTDKNIPVPQEKNAYITKSGNLKKLIDDDKTITLFDRKDDNSKQTNGSKKLGKIPRRAG